MLTAGLVLMVAVGLAAAGEPELVTFDEFYAPLGIRNGIGSAPVIGSVVLTHGRGSRGVSVTAADYPDYTGSPSLELYGSNRNYLYIGMADGGSFVLNGLSIAETDAFVGAREIEVRGYLNGERVTTMKVLTDGQPGSEAFQLMASTPVTHVEIELKTYTSRPVLIDDISVTPDAVDLSKPERIGFHNLYSDQQTIDLDVANMRFGSTYAICQSADLKTWEELQEFVAHAPSDVFYVRLLPHDGTYFVVVTRKN
ncbi:hypothetical protein BH23VER1_BH23VER1_21020 [soil metagenome]